jgi:hypothetical protein
MSFAETFFRKNIQAAEEIGTEVQQDDMAGLVAVNSQLLNELGDILGGRRNQKDHPHHPVDDLVKGVIVNVSEILKLRREINGKR